TRQPDFLRRGPLIRAAHPTAEPTHALSATRQHGWGARTTDRVKDRNRDAGAASMRPAGLSAAEENGKPSVCWKGIYRLVVDRAAPSAIAFLIARWVVKARGDRSIRRRPA